MTKRQKIRVAITHGDTNGIGYEVIIKALADLSITELCTPVIYGSSKVLSYHRKALDLAPLPFTVVKNTESIKDGAVNIMDVVTDEVKVELGQPGKQAGRAAFQALEGAVRDLKRGAVDVLVTGPINKDNIQSDDFHFPGHTEYLQSSLGDGNKAMMMMCSENLRVALVTIHTPLAKVSQAITQELIQERVKQLNASLQRDFGLERPRIAVLALNPHAGKNGLMGNEEKDVIEPALQACYDQGIVCFGPYAADGFFGNYQYRHFDGVLAMYHDQGLAPFKALAMDQGVNYTAGLPYVRTSPDHGTGYDNAGKNVAHESSLRQAIYLAVDIYRNRQRWDEAHANPLGKLYEVRGKDNVVLDLTRDDDDQQ